MTPIVSIVVPCYNKGRFLAETLDSVMNQCFTDWECVIINDGSSDNTETIAKEYCLRDERFRYISQGNLGVSAARNNGILQSSGKYLLPLDSDDLLSERYLSEAVPYMEGHPECKLVYPLVESFGAKTGLYVLGEYSYEKELLTNCIVCSAVFRRADYDNTSGYNINMKEGLEDWDFWLSLLSENDIVKRLDITGLYYRLSDDSRNTRALEYKRELYKTIVQNHPTKYEKYYDDILFYMTSYEPLKNKLDRILNSFSYKLGEAIAAPYRKIRYWSRDK